MTENRRSSIKEIAARAAIDACASCGVDPVFELRSVLFVKKAHGGKRFAEKLRRNNKQSERFY